MMGYVSSACRICREVRHASGRLFESDSHFCEKHTSAEIDKFLSKPASCAAQWIGIDRKDHACGLDHGHDGKCICSCGARARVANPRPKWEPKPFYKRRKRVQP